MINNLKALLVVLFLALPVFAIAKSLCLKFMAEDDFVRRRNVWLTLTITAFISPNFWIYCGVALALMYWAGRKDANPVALYVLLLHVIPPFSLELPSVLVNRLFAVDNYRLLAFAILVPYAWKIFFTKKKARSTNQKWIDRSLWAYLALQIVLLMPYEDITNTFRRGFLWFVDCILLVYVVSRLCNTREKQGEVLASFCLACAIFVPIAVIESLKGWLLYNGILDLWGMFSQNYILRDGMLRALASTGHSLALGYILAVAFAFWQYVSSREKSPTTRLAGDTGYWVGLIAALSRAPWFTAVLAYLSYSLMVSGGLRRLGRTMVILGPVSVMVLISPLGPKIIDKLPFIGTVDSANVEYRERLAQSSWELIQKNPVFGDPFFMRNLEHMRQGQGIIDLVNVYASIALLYGITGLLLFLLPYILTMQVVWKRQREAAKTSPDLSSLGASMFAAMLASAFFMVTGSFSGLVPKVYYLLVGLGVTYGQLQSQPPQQPARQNK